MLTEHDCLADQQLIQQMTTDELKTFLQQDLSTEQAQSLNAALQSCQQGVQRVHLIQRKTDGALLLNSLLGMARGL